MKVIVSLILAFLGLAIPLAYLFIALRRQNKQDGSGKNRDTTKSPSR